MFEAGEEIYNTRKNTVGHIVEIGSDKQVAMVRTSEGLKRWQLSDCEIVSEED